jgi:hypothetical protein
MSPNQGLLFFAIPSGVIFYLLVLRVAGTGTAGGTGSVRSAG